MNNKSLLIKAPSSIDADLPVWNALKITWKVTANNYKGGSNIPECQTGPFNADDKFEITEQDADTAVAISKKNFFGGITISPDTEVPAQFTVTVTGDDVYYITQLSVTFGAFYIVKVDSMFGEGLDTITNLTNLIRLDMYRSNTSGDIAKLKTLTNLNYLNFGSTKVTGDIAELKTLTNLNSLEFSYTKVTGDIAELKTLTNLKTMWLYATNVFGDVSQLKTLTNLIVLGLADTNIWGDISVLSPTILKLTCGAFNSEQNVSWPSPTARSSKTKIPLNLIGANNRACNFGDDLDNFLIDEAACTNYSGNTYGKSITAKGNRTSASDNAIQTLQSNGWTVKII